MRAVLMGLPVGWEVLGLGGDPTPGDPLVVVGVARSFERVADDAEVAERGVRSLVSDGAVLAWVGAAGEVFGGAVGEFPEQLGKCKDSFRLGARALVGWAQDLESAQHLADRALALGREAAANVESAQVGLGQAQGRASSVERVADVLLQRQGLDGSGVVPSSERVRLAHREAVVARAGVAAAQVVVVVVVVEASQRLAAARAMALDAASLRAEGGRVAARRVYEAAGAGIAPRSVWESLRDVAARVWDITIVVAKVVVAVLEVVALIIGGPLAWVVFAAALLVLADTLAKYAQGQATGWDVVLALIACIPATKGLTTLAGLGKGLKAVGGVRSVGQALTLAGGGGRLAGMLLREPSLALRQFASNPSIRLQRMALQVRHMSPINAYEQGVNAYRMERADGGKWWGAINKAEDARFWGFRSGFVDHVYTTIAPTQPARAAQLMQGAHGFFGVDNMNSQQLNTHDLVVTTGPGSGGWMVRLDELAPSVDGTGVVHSNLYNTGVQVGPNPAFPDSPLRDQLHVFSLKKPLVVGSGHALANPQFGVGGTARAWSPHIDNDLLRTGENEFFIRVGKPQQMVNFGPEAAAAFSPSNQYEAQALRRAMHAPWRAVGFVDPQGSS